MSSGQAMGSLVAPWHTTLGGGLHEGSMNGFPWCIVGLSHTRMHSRCRPSQPRPPSGFGCVEAMTSLRSQGHVRRDWEAAMIGFLSILGNHVVGSRPAGRLVDHTGRKERTHSHSICSLGAQWRRRSDADCFPKIGGLWGESFVQHEEHGEMICGRCFRVHSNRPGDTEENGEALLKRASFEG